LSPRAGRDASPAGAASALTPQGEARNRDRPGAGAGRPLRGATTCGRAGRTVSVVAAIEITGLTKRYGRIVAVDDLSFTAPAGSVTGFVGRNGAGKSTTLRLLLGLARPDAGGALVNGARYATLRSPLREVGALLDVSAPDPGRRGSDHLLWLARSNGLARSRVDETLELVGLAQAARRRVRGYSLGMRQRLGIAAALLGDPPVLVLDEPANGLDPEGIVWLRRFLRSLAGEGRAVLVSSHLMAELEGTADRVVVIGRGRLIAEAGVAELLAAESGDRVRLRTPRGRELTAVLAAAGGAVASERDGELVVSGLDPAEIAALAAAGGLPVHELAPRRATLEEAFLRLTGEGAP
jgi:ABC-2 type transport system ATP-binding protein